jgi:hypothetical protein
MRRRVRTRIAARTLIAVVLLATPAAARAQTTCPADHATSRAVAARFLTHPAYADARQVTATAGYAPAHVRLLTDAADLAVCTRLRQEIQMADPAWAWTAYRVGPVYVVAFRSIHGDGSYHMEQLPVMILSDDLEYLGSWGM